MTTRDPFELVDNLGKRGVTYAIIGGHAVNFHGYLRSTEDIDIVFLRSASNEIALYESLAELGAYWITDEVDLNTGLEKIEPITLAYVKANALMMLGSRVGFVDIFDFLPGLSQAELDDFFASTVASHGRRFASLAWLRRLKEASNRPQDRIDLEKLP